MAIYRGPGGAGDAVADTTNQSEIATTKAAEASSSAAAAASSASAASTSATNAASSASSASTSASSAAASASTASTSATSASNSASSASTSASAAAQSATEAETAQTAAETAQTAAEAAQAAAETAETNAETAETNAEAAQSAAEAARDAALAALDSFDDRYLGQKASDPSVDNDGNALVAGALYFNTATNVMKVYDGSAWLTAYSAGSGSIDDLTDVIITSASNGQVLKYNGTNWVNTAETDPVFSASEAASITSTDTTNWDTAYGWGNHASAGYLTSETYTGTVTSVDMTVPTGLAVTGNPVTSSGTLAVAYATGYAIPTTAKQTNWDTAYGWGNHASAGYLTSFTETNDLTAAVTWANVPDANITQSSVTQHQAALSITEGQISNLGSDIVLNSDIGVTVQSYDADTAKTDTAQTFTASQRGTVTTDNDGSFDLSVTNNFKCTAAASPTDLTFTNMTAGQSGFILLDNSGAYTIGQGTGTKVSATALATMSAAGVYLLSYFTDGTNTYVVNSGALA